MNEHLMTDRERVCAEKWIHAAIDLEDPDLADYWQEQGLEAKEARLAGLSKIMKEN